MNNGWPATWIGLMSPTLGISWAKPTNDQELANKYLPSISKNSSLKYANGGNPFLIFPSFSKDEKISFVNDWVTSIYLISI